MNQLLCCTNSSWLGGSKSYAVSDYADLISEQLKIIANDFLRSVYHSNRFEAISAIDTVCSEASENDWDGYGGEPVSQLTREVAVDFLISLPLSYPTPEVSADPDGEISFEWWIEPGYSFLISIGEWKRISYAGLFGSNSVHGQEHFGDELPDSIVFHLNKHFQRKPTGG